MITSIDSNLLDAIKTTRWIAFIITFLRLLVIFFIVITISWFRVLLVYLTIHYIILVLLTLFLVIFLHFSSIFTFLWLIAADLQFFRNISFFLMMVMLVGIATLDIQVTLRVLNRLFLVKRSVTLVSLIELYLMEYVLDTLCSIVFARFFLLVNCFVHCTSFLMDAFYTQVILAGNRFLEFFLKMSRSSKSDMGLTTYASLRLFSFLAFWYSWSHLDIDFILMNRRLEFVPIIRINDSIIFSYICSVIWWPNINHAGVSIKFIVYKRLAIYTSLKARELLLIVLALLNQILYLLYAEKIEEF